MQTVLLTAIGSASTHAVCQSYHRAGYRVIGCDIYPPEWHVNTQDMDAFFNVPFATDEAAYLEALLTAVRLHRVDVVVPLTDVEVDALCAHKGLFREAGATLCCPEPQVADVCRDKLRMAQTLGDAKLCTVIPTYTAATVPADLDFPLMIKPVRGRSSQAQVIAHTQAELTQALQVRADYIIQPYLTGDVYTVDCARDAAGKCVTLTRWERLRTGNGLGTAVEICPQHPLYAICSGILAYVNIVGVVNMEFIHHGDAYYFLEVNPRFSGGVGFSMLAGYDFALAMLACHQGMALPPLPAIRRMTLAQRYEMAITKLDLQDGYNP